MSILESTVRLYARRAVHALGQPVILKRVTVGTYNTTTGTATNMSEDQELVGRVDEYLDREMNSTIHVGDRKLLLAAVDITWAPRPKDTVTIADVDHDVVSVKHDIAATLPAIYTLQLRPYGG